MGMESQIFFSWFAPEYNTYPHQRHWYTMLGILIFFSSLIAFWFGNFLFAIFLILSGLIIAGLSLRDPREIEIIVTEHEIFFGTRAYHYNEFKSFWLNEDEEGTKKLFLASADTEEVTLIPVDESVDPFELNDFLETKLPEEPIAEPVMEVLVRRMRI